MVFVLCALLDPFFDDFFLFFGEGAVGVLGGHGVVFVEDAEDDFGVFGGAGDDGGGAFMFFVGEFGEVEGDVAFTGFGVLSVAVEAVFREDGSDVFVVGDLFFGNQGGGEEKRGERPTLDVGRRTLKFEEEGEEAIWHDGEAEAVEGRRESCLRIGTVGLSLDRSCN